MQLAVVLCAVFTIGLSLGTIAGYTIHTVIADLDRRDETSDATIIDWPGPDAA
jgi:hypothetical protein